MHNHPEYAIGRHQRASAMAPDEFKALRKAAGYSQAQFARLLGLTRNTVYFWERGTTPVPKWAVLIAKILLAKRQALVTGQRPTLTIDQD